VRVELSVLYGELSLLRFILRRFGDVQFDETLLIKTGDKVTFTVGGI
jgi:hypothetical protein